VRAAAPSGPRRAVEAGCPPPPRVRGLRAEPLIVLVIIHYQFTFMFLILKI